MANLRSTTTGEARSGWVSELSDAKLVLRFEDMQEFSVDETYVMELFGRDSTVSFAASFTDSKTSDFYELFKAGALSSDSALDLEFIDVEHNFKLASTLLFRPYVGTFRIAVWNVSAEMEFIGSPIELNVLNIGEDTIGCYCPLELDTKSKHEILIRTSFGELKLDGTVVECRSINDEETQFRVLFHISPSGRLHAGRWRRFIDQQALAA